MIGYNITNIQQQYKLIALNLNLSTNDIILLKKNILFSFKYIKQKIIFNNLKLYGNYILLNTLNKKFDKLSKKILPIMYIYNNKNISQHKYQQLNKQRFKINTPIISFIQTLKKRHI
jgi:hypothetical protein